ncbi:MULTISPECIES: TldD/PmbA family protein [Psychrilyobacter]|uniref:TldD/PmbA family protein n=1 Tax=Psychrilyobacter piezotolerans TaxID=2293438 RepID=A0ABX9KHX0_9FUSO|nr:MULTISPECIES: TldD/PmbA family protein [Psychrilyobacter]MCS5422632.1 TldD/PmbA family protein [Psychrilyobacter sp. S5]NDI77637.1 TldD/PmbA family protein [Psychrilyobacter piezotolerans]RDE62646.1 TldD/PmbA family protein [Psychrilyobacter sp. S5]REI41576.1 TldD/PmbA family protein [Psychrilyobacter piezotolerans]
MLSREIIKKIFKTALVSGDFAEIFFEKKDTFSLTLSSQKIEKVLSGSDFGVGVRILDRSNAVYGYTNNLSDENLLLITKKLADSLEKKENSVEGRLGKPEVEENKHKIRRMPDTVPVEEKVALLKKVDKAAREYDEKISQVEASYFDTVQNIKIINSEGLNRSDTRVHTRLRVECIAKDGENVQTGSSAPGGQKGFEFYSEDVDVAEAAKEAARQAVTLLSAEDAPSKEMTVIMENGFGGVIFHEACGHGLEATSVAKKLSVFTDKIGEKIASSCVTAIDDGTIANGWGSLNIDDEGHRAQKNILIKDGILQGYMIDKLGGRRMEGKSSGSGRRESYKFAPTSRMTNTFIAPGTSTLEEMLKDVKFGLYAKSMGGGSVNTTTGDFNFSVREGYLIEDGKITTPVKGATLIGSGPEILHKIDMVGDNLSCAQGVCGSLSGHIPTDVGQPRIRVSSITVGGKK